MEVTPSPAMSRWDPALLMLANSVRTTLFHLCELGWAWPNVGFSLAAWTSFMTSYRFVATILVVILAIRLLRMPEGEMRRSGHGPGSFARLPTCLTHYELIGAADSPSLVIVCHGFSGDLSHAMPLATELTNAGHRVLIYDLVGRGFSSCRNHCHTIELFVSQLAELVFALGLADRPAHLVGISLGGGIVSEYASYFPQRVASLTLIASVGLPLCASAHTLLKLPILPDILLRCALWSTVLAGLEHEWADDSDPKLQTMIRSYRDRVKNEPALGRSLLSTARHFPLEALHATFCKIGAETYPVLIIWGEDDRTCPIRNAHSIQRDFIKRADLVVVKGARHCVYTEFCGDVAYALVKFLCRCTGMDSLAKNPALAKPLSTKRILSLSPSPPLDLSAPLIAVSTPVCS